VDDIARDDDIARGTVDVTVEGTACGTVSDMVTATSSLPPEPLESFARLVRRRRTSMAVDQDRPVDTALIEQLCDLAMWAPNHKRTWPWRFASFCGDARLRLGEAFVDDMVDLGIGDDGKRLKTRSKYARTPTVVVIGSASHEHRTFHDENRDAVAAGIQNLLLGATASGLASFWSTPPLIDSPRALSLCGFEPDTRIIGVVYLGWPSRDPDPGDRPAARVLHLR
jgi:nitroreductase